MTTPDNAVYWREVPQATYERVVREIKYSYFTPFQTIEVFLPCAAVAATVGRHDWMRGAYLLRVA
jgi:hypothetical protein